MIKKILARYFVTLAKGYADHSIINRTLSLSNRAITLDPTYAEAYMLRGWARCAKGDQVEEGKADLDTAASLKPNSKEVLLRRAAVDGNLGHYTQAIEATDQILATDTDNFEAIVTRGTA